MEINGQLHGNYMLKINTLPPAPEATAEELPQIAHELSYNLWKFMANYMAIIC